MDDSLISYIGIDNVLISDFTNTFDYKFEGTHFIDDNIENLLSFSVYKECFDYNMINDFEEKDFYGNIVILKNKFDLCFEYGSENDKFSLKMESCSIYNAHHILLPNYDSFNIDINLLVKNIYCTLISPNEIFYSINLLISVN